MTDIDESRLDEASAAQGEAEEDLIDQLVAYAQGTCLSLSAIAAHFELEDEEEWIEERLLDRNIEVCNHCGWWMESSELATDEDFIGTCTQCLDDVRPKGDDE